MGKYETKILDLNKSDVVNDNDGYIACDGLIAPTILILNEKGYKTTASCSGHSTTVSAVAPIEIDRIADVSLDEQVLDSVMGLYQMHKIVMFTGADDRKLYFQELGTDVDVYVNFSEECEFPYHPEGFTDFSMTSVPSLHKVIKRKKPDGSFKGIPELDREIEAANESLLRWAKSLGYRSVRRI